MAKGRPQRPWAGKNRGRRPAEAAKTRENRLELRVACHAGLFLAEIFREGGGVIEVSYRRVTQSFYSEINGTGFRNLRCKIPRFTVLLSRPLFPRRIEPRMVEALLDTPVVLLAGPRQAGKTTLVRQIAAQQGLRYLTLDDELTLLSAREDPVGMIRSLDRAVIDVK